MNHYQRKTSKNIITASFLVLVLGGIILFFTKNTVPREKESFVKLTCRDSDGDDTKTKGAVTYTDAGGKHVDEDYCDPTEKSVYEMICHKDSFWSSASLPEKKTVPCPKGCINGACVR